MGGQPRTQERRRHPGGDSRHLARAAGSPHLVLAGYSGWQNAVLIDPTDRAALGPALHQLGRLPEADLQALYAGAAVFAFPSRRTRALASRSSRPWRLVCPSWPRTYRRYGRWPGGPPNWSAPVTSGGGPALGALVGSSPRREELARRGRARAAEFSWAKTAAATAEIYASCWPEGNGRTEVGSSFVRVLVTGSIGGFVGPWLLRSWIDEGDEVVELPLAVDIADAGAVAEALTPGRPEAVYHLAAHRA